MSLSSGVSHQVSDRINSFLKQRAIPGLKIETWGTQRLTSRAGDSLRI
jgi:hypothetical protein